MADVLTAEQRHRNMVAIKGRDTRPEMHVRSLLHSLGYRYRLHQKDLPGKPDLVFPRLRKIIFVHGCFWHMHRCRYGRVIPATNTDFWQKKRNSNVERDKQNIATLRKFGWDILILWECQTKDSDILRRYVSKFLPTR
jgi:DNA mismatch endonuclease (patch repair protein)